MGWVRDRYRTVKGTGKGRARDQTGRDGMGSSTIFSKITLEFPIFFSNFYLIQELPDPGKDTSAVGAREPDVANFILKFWQLESFGQTVTDIPVSFNATLKCTFLI